VDGAGAIKAIQSGIAQARELFAADPADFAGELSDDDLVAFIYSELSPLLHKPQPTTPEEREKLVEDMAVAIEENGEWFEPSKQDFVNSARAAFAVAEKALVGK
jgi:hypothetical protein